ncbi:CHAD domain-containing protein [Ideonella oryzae]|uniref:CHAD domain-containing protein n=1 Tax=Ideonella oryzae TaxID=2937441 RepID=A0ABT1BKY0_9BURK|nr:CHAD domain-containing protein [Ideonella oryzae]MCO5976768.1 CHAD domain-containing protein [Ideonella oryzae]
MRGLTVFEIELKFQVPAGAEAAVRRAVGTAQARRQRLRARYLDTPDRRLARARAALRLRDEGAHWVQTFKAEGDNPMQRLEHEVVLPGGELPPDPDLARHADTPAAAALARALGIGVLAGDGQAQGLAVHFETDIQRLSRVVRLPGGARVELAFDVGMIRAGGREWPVCELEFELVQGEPADLLALARRWVDRHGLWLDVRSKAERGHLLAAGRWASPPARGEAPVLRNSQRPERALQSLLRAALGQVLANAAVLADAALPALGERDEYLRQCRIGLRRLRTVLRVLVPPEAAGLQADPAWEAALAEVFRRLGLQRDRDALAQGLLPALQAAGAPWTDALQPTGADVDVGAELRHPGFTRLLIALLAFVQTPGGLPAGTADRPSLRRWMRACLAPLHKQVRRDAKAYAALDEAAHHRLRKRVKRLRYLLEMSASLWPAKALARHLAALREAQDALGSEHDQALAQALFAQAAEQEPRAWWAVGWLQAQRQTQGLRCDQVLQALRRTDAAWD